MITRALVCPELVGRRAEIDELVGLAREVGRGRGGIVLVEGDAGIGKSRLLDELRARVRRGRTAIVSGNCYEFGAAPYQPFLEIFDALGGSGDLFGEHTQAEQFKAVVARLERASAHRSTICLIEDVHWADEATLQLLSHLAVQIARYRVLLVLTARSDDLRRDPVVLAHVGRITRLATTTRILLQPLDPIGVAQLIRLTLEGRASLPREAVDEIVARSEGNPFFAEELLKNALERLHSNAADSLPLAIRAMVADRVSLLDAGGRRLLAIAAVIARPFAPAFLSQIAGVADSEVLPALRFGCESQVLVDLRTEPITYGFRHALTREAVAHELLAVELRPLHRRIAEALEAQMPDHVSDIGYHYWAARAPEKARLYNERAGQAAEHAHAFGDAVRFYERALEMIDDPLEQAPIFANVARCLAHSGEPDRARRIYEAATAVYRSAGQMAEAANLYYSLVAAAHFAGDLTSALDLSESALAMLPPDADYGEANQRTHITLCAAYINADLGRVAAARRMLRDASATAATAQNIAVTSMFENTRMRCALVAGDADGLRAAAEGYRDVVRRLGDAEYETRSHLNIAADAFALGLDDVAEREFGIVIPQLHERRWLGYEGVARALEAQRLFRHGKLAEARAMLEAAGALPTEMSLGRANIATAALRIGAALADDNLIERLVDPDILDRTLRTGAVFESGPLLGAHAGRLAERGEPLLARQILAQALTGGEHPLPFGPAFAAAARFGDRALIATVRRAFAQVDPQLAVALPVRAHRATFEAVAAGRRGDKQGAIAAGAEARRHFEALGWRYDVAAACEAAGEFDAAVALFGEIGAVGDVRRLERLATPARGALSEREREIALLVAGGAANRAIARQLTVSEKTVEKHLSSIYAKLGFSKRTELTAYIVRGAERSA